MIDSAGILDANLASHRCASCAAQPLPQVEFMFPGPTLLTSRPLLERGTRGAEDAHRVRRSNAVFKDYEVSAGLFPAGNGFGRVADGRKSPISFNVKVRQIRKRDRCLRPCRCSGASRRPPSWSARCC
jgi:hypothetical protein